MANMSVREWQVAFNNGDFDSPDFKTQCDAGWYDWFCKDSSLRNKTKKLGNIVKKVKDGGRINLDTMYVWFKNNCPFVGPLYDDFRFADIETGNVIYTIAVGDKMADHRFDVWGAENGFAGPICGFDTQKDLVAWLNSPVC
jgi:hypothetical protein